MVCRGVHASHSKSLQHRNRGQHSSFIAFPCRATDTRDSSMVQTSSVPITRLESLCTFLCILLSVSIRNQDTCVRTWAGFQTISCLEKWLHQADPDLGGSQGGDHMALLQPSWFHFHCWDSYCGVFLWKKTDANRKFHASGFILETILFQCKNSLSLQEFEI